MNRIKIYAFMLFAFFGVSCGNFLDINPKAEVVNEDMFKDAQGCEDAVMGIYGQMKDTSLYGKNLSWHITDVLAQDLNAKTISTTNPYQYLGHYNYNDAAGILLTMWTKSYEVIGHVNNAIENLETKAPGTFPLQDLYLGECYGLRAFLHFDMLRLFAPHVERAGGANAIPYVTKYSFKHTPFSTVNQCYDYLIGDLKKAQTLLVADEGYMTYPRKDVSLVRSDFLKGREIHFNYYAVTALLARVYWTKGDLANAKIEALKVINSDKFPLADKDQIARLISGSLSPKESIFGIYSTTYFTTVSDYLAYSRTGSASPFRDADNAKYPLTYNAVYAKNLGDNSGVDSRLGWFGSMSDSDTGIGYMCHKVFDKVRVKVESDTPASRGLIEGISVLRVPEMYYIVAEAYLEEGDSKAYDYFDKVLLSRGLTRLSDRVPAITLTKEIIYNERHKELFCEGQRWFDMKKMNMDIVSNTESLTFPASDRYYVLPIPTEEFDYRN